MRETQVPFPGWEDPLEKEMGTHSSILAWKIPWTEESGRLLSMKSQRVRHDLGTEHGHTQMQLEIIILSEVNQKEKDKYHMISLICGI